MPLYPQQILPASTSLSKTCKPIFVTSIIPTCHLFILWVKKKQQARINMLLFFNKNYRFSVNYLVFRVAFEFEEANGTWISDILYCLVVLLASHKGLWHCGAPRCYRWQLGFLGLSLKLLFSLSLENSRCLQCARVKFVFYLIPKRLVIKLNFV